MLSKLAVVLLVAVTTVNAQCSTLCLLFPHELAQRQPVDASQSEGCHRHGSQVPDQPSNGTPCGHQLCVSEKGPQVTPPALDSGPVFPVISAAVSVAPEQVASAGLVEDPSPPPIVNLAAKAILRI